MYFLGQIFAATDQLLFFTRDSVFEEASYTEEYLAAQNTAHFSVYDE